MRYDIAKALGRLGAVEPLIDIIKDIDKERDKLSNTRNDILLREYMVRSTAIEALGQIGDARAVEPLINTLKNDNSSNRREAATALGKIGDKRAVPALSEAALRDDYVHVREDAVKALKYLGCEITKEQLIRINYDLMADNDERNRCDAAEKLLEIAEPEGISWLVKALMDDNSNRFLAAAWTVCYSFRIDEIKRSIGEETFCRTIKGAMTSVIEKITNAELQQGINALNEVTTRALQVIEKYGDESALASLNELLANLNKKREDEGYRKEYIQTADYGGWVDNEGKIEMVNRIIKNIEKRQIV